MNTNSKFRIGFLLTITPWNERRLYRRQAPSLNNNESEVIYIANFPKENVDSQFCLHKLSRFQSNKIAFGKKRGFTPQF